MALDPTGAVLTTSLLLAQGLSSFVCFVDFKKTFDSIPRDFLWLKMELKGKFEK